MSAPNDPMAGVEARPGSPKPDPILVVDGIRRTFGGLTAVNVEHLEIQRGVITALIGPNGAGKTTFFNLLTGFDRPDAGTRVFDGRRLDQRRPLPRVEGGAGLVAALAGAVVGWAIVAWLWLRAFDTSAFSVGTAAVVAVGGLVFSVQRARRQGALAALGGWGAAMVGAVLLGLLYAALVTPTTNWTTVLLIVTATLATAAVVAGWRYATSPPAPYELAGTGMVRTFQLTKALTRLSVIENMKLGAPRQRGERFVSALLSGRWRAQERDIEARSDALLERFGMSHMRDQMAGTLSGGQRKLLEMARSLMTDPSVVMLDEPMAGVNPALTQSLLEHVKALPREGRTVVFVEHDMDVVQEISDWVVVMAEGEIIAEGPPASIGRNQQVIDAYLGRDDDLPIVEPSS
ncbi:MAG: ATP-binding cassette domain-containing protein [Acidimicrobiia bacterium]|nr:ATP-binding cassette domain-containing protein [Acidimicrobiia bacterium]